MIKYLFLDLDDTILDFKKAESIAIRRVMAEFGLEPTDALAARYSAVNDLHWKALERGEMTRDQVLSGRFAMFFGEQGIEVDAEKVARTYERFLSQGHWFLPGAEETVKQKLFGRYKLYLASNGTAVVQKGRMTSADLYPYFEESFVSQELGHNKPSKEYFEAAFARIPGFDPKQCLMVGDSLTSDILGGKNAGLRTVWVNPHHKSAPEHLKPDYEIEFLADLPALLEEIE
jgi:2-haloacid dehalogenase